MLVRIGTKVYADIKACGLQHLDQHRRDVAVDAFKAVDSHTESLAVLRPQTVGILGKSGLGHELRALGQVDFARLILLLKRLDFRRIGEPLEAGVEREWIDR